MITVTWCCPAWVHRVTVIIGASGRGGHRRHRVEVMQERTLGRTGLPVGVVGLGAWQLGGDWGEVNEDNALPTLVAAYDAGVTFIDTADCYADRPSERLVGPVLP